MAYLSPARAAAQYTAVNDESLGDLGWGKAADPATSVGRLPRGYRRQLCLVAYNLEPGELEVESRVFDLDGTLGAGEIISGGFESGDLSGW